MRKPTTLLWTQKASAQGSKVTIKIRKRKGIGRGGAECNICTAILQYMYSYIATYVQLYRVIEKDGRDLKPL